MEKAIVLLSGGQDSTTCLMWAIKKFGQGAIIALSFDYGQKHAVELDVAKKIALRLGVRWLVRKVEGLTGESALTEHTDTNVAHPVNHRLPSSFTPGRNALFLTVAAGIGYSRGIHDIVAGVCQTDYSGYPDCRKEFIDLQAAALSAALDAPVSIHTPLMQLTKAETWRLAYELSPHVSAVCNLPGPSSAFELVRKDTVTDYNGDATPNDWGKGKEDNPASVLRAAGFREAKANGWI